MPNLETKYLNLTLKNPIIPTVYFVAPNMAWNYAVRIHPDNISKTIGYIEDVYTKFNQCISDIFGQTGVVLRYKHRFVSGDF